MGRDPSTLPVSPEPARRLAPAGAVVAAREHMSPELSSPAHARLTQNRDGYPGASRWTDTQAHPVDPTYSPNGTKIAFSYGGPELGDDIWVMNADGTGERKVTNRI